MTKENYLRPWSGRVVVYSPRLDTILYISFFTLPFPSVFDITHCKQRYTEPTESKGAREGEGGIGDKDETGAQMEYVLTLLDPMSVNQYFFSRVRLFKMRANLSTRTLHLLS